MRASFFGLLLAASISTPHPWPYVYFWKAAPAAAKSAGDADILGTIGSIDANEIEASKLAATKAGSREVKDYAAALLRDHTQSQQAGMALAKQLQITILMPKDTSMESAHKVEMDQLNALSSSAFDKPFVLAMVADHQAALKKLAAAQTAAKHPELRAYIQRLQPIVAMHQTTGQSWLDKQKP